MTRLESLALKVAHEELNCELEKQVLFLLICGIHAEDWEDTVYFALELVDALYPPGKEMDGTTWHI